MIQKFDGSNERGYRIHRKNREDGICITLEFNNEEYHLHSEIIKEYRLFIDYTREENQPNTMYFKDGRLISGNIDYSIFKMIKKELASFPKKDRLYLKACLREIDISKAIEDSLESKTKAL